jgi:hypothetical protein
MVVPVTHSPPENPSLCIEIPPETKRRLGLDAARSWIVVSEGNEFIWPGPDLRPLPGRDLSTAAYGLLPPRLFDMVRERFVALARSGRAKRVPRTE